MIALRVTKWFVIQVLNFVIDYVQCHSHAVKLFQSKKFQKEYKNFRN